MESGYFESTLHEQSHVLDHRLLQTKDLATLSTKLRDGKVGRNDEVFVLALVLDDDIQLVCLLLGGGAVS